MYRRASSVYGRASSALLYSTWQSKSGVFQHCLRTFLVCLSTFLHAFLCAHFCGTPALLACISTTLKHSLHASQLLSSTTFEHTCTRIKYWKVVGMHAHSAGTRQGCARIYTVFQHCLRAFLCLHVHLLSSSRVYTVFIYCLHVLEIKACTIFRFSSSVFASSSLKTKLLKQFLPPIGAGSLPVTSV